MVLYYPETEEEKSSEADSVAVFDSPLFLLNKELNKINVKKKCTELVMKTSLGCSGLDINYLMLGCSDGIINRESGVTSGAGGEQMKHSRPI